MGENMRTAFSALPEKENYDKIRMKY